MVQGKRPSQSLGNSSRKKEGDGKPEDHEGRAAGPTDHVGGLLAKIDHMVRNVERVSTQTDLYRSLNLRCVALVQQLAEKEDHLGRQLRALRREADFQACIVRVQLGPGPWQLHMGPQSGPARDNQGNKDCLP